MIEERMLTTDKEHSNKIIGFANYWKESWLLVISLLLGKYFFTFDKLKKDLKKEIEIQSAIVFQKYPFVSSKHLMI